MDRSPYALHARTALDKLLADLAEPVKHEVSRPTALTTSLAAGLATAAWIDATSDHQLVSLTYRSDPEPRVVEPYSVLEAQGGWYLIGWCRRRDAVRGFRVDAVCALTVVDEVFVPTHAPEVARDLGRWSPQTLV